jgi:hypothetical protein
MAVAPTAAQEDLRTVTVSAKVTKAEKDALRLVAAFDQTTEADLLRDSTIALVMAHADEIRALRRPANGAEV